MRRLRDGASRFMRVHNIKLHDGMTAAEKAAVRLAVTTRSWKHHAQRHMRCDGGVRRHGEIYWRGETKEGAGVFANAQATNHTKFPWVHPWGDITGGVVARGARRTTTSDGSAARRHRPPNPP